MAEATQTNEQQSSPPIQDVYLKLFQKNNPHCKFAVENGSLFLQNPWGSEDCRLSYDLSDVESIKELNNLAFFPQFDAIIHVDSNEIEFIFAYIIPDQEPAQSYLNRKFTLHFDSVEYICRFSEPTTRLLDIATRYRRIPTDPGTMVVPQLRAFRDAQQPDKLSEGATAFFSNRVPRNFFLKPSHSVLDLKIEDIARHINLIMNYYDRSTPEIEMRKDNEDHHKRVKPKRFCENSFPNTLVLHRIDEYVLSLIEVARETEARFAFIYYYQVIEYAGFYFVDEKVRKSLKKFLRDPAMITCPEEKMHDLFAVLSDLAHNDEARRRKVIEECCDPNILWLEIENDRDCFCNELQLDGGFILSALISADTSQDSWATMWMPKLYDQLTKIRNCLVHARERRQSNVILPTATNNSHIKRYLPLIARIAEQIALKQD